MPTKLGEDHGVFRMVERSSMVLGKRLGICARPRGHQEDPAVTALSAQSKELSQEGRSDATSPMRRIDHARDLRRVTAEGVPTTKAEQLLAIGPPQQVVDLAWVAPTEGAPLKFEASSIRQHASSFEIGDGVAHRVAQTMGALEHLSKVSGAQPADDRARSREALKKVCGRAHLEASVDADWSRRRSPSTGSVVIDLPLRDGFVI
jgi:hypothetical protein